MSTAVQDAELIDQSPPASDAELVERFVVTQDQSAFAELVNRHSSVVLAVCRRAFRDTNDIDDVFQATFLVLVRDAGRLRNRQSLASWLYGIAYRLSLCVSRQKRRRRETVLMDETLSGDMTFESLTERHEQQLLDAELNALPEKYRQPLVLKYLVGRSTSEIAAELGVTIGQIEGQLKRGKEELRHRLLRRGISLGVALASLQWVEQVVDASSRMSLIEKTVQAGLTWNHQQSAKGLTDLVSERAVELAAKEVAMMTVTVKFAVTAGVAVAAIAFGIGGIGLMNGHSAGTAEASGIVTTIGSNEAARFPLELASLSVEPAAVSKDKLVTAGTLRGDEKTNPKPEPADQHPTVQPEDPSIPLRTYLGNSLPFPPKRWDSKQRSQRELEIEQALKGQIEFNFKEMPLKDSLDFIQSVNKIAIRIDEKGLSDAAIAIDSAVSLALEGVSLRSGLELLLEPLQLDYIVQNEVLTITTSEIAMKTFETRFYPPELLGKVKADDIGDLVEVITGTVAPNTWNALLAADRQSSPKKIGDASAGNSAEDSSLMGTIRIFKNGMVIRQTQRVHKEITDLLTQLEDETKLKTIPIY